MALFARQRPRSKRVLLNKVFPGVNGAEQPALESRHLLPVLLIWVLLLAGTVALIALGGPPMRYALGDLVTRDVYARTNFKYLDEAETERLLRQAAEKVLDIYRKETDALMRSKERLGRLLDDIQEAAPTEETTTEPAGDPSGRDLKIPEEVLATLKADLNKKEKSLVRTALTEIFKGISAAGLVGSDDVLQTARIRVMEVSPRDSTRGVGSTEPVVRDTSSLLTPTGLGKMTRQILEGHLKRSGSALTEALAEWLEQNVRPTLVFDLDSTAEDRARARQETPVKEVSVARNELLFAAGTRIESLQLHILTQEQRAYLAQLGSETQYHVKRLAGITLTVLLVYGVGLAYLVRYRHRILRSPGRLAAMVGLLLLMVTIARLCVQLRWSHYVVPVSLLTIGLALAHGRRFALMVSFFALVPVAVTLGNDFSALVVLLMGVLVAALLTVHINKRTKLIVVGFMVGLVQVVAIWAIGLLDQTETVVLLRHSLFGMGNGLFVGFLVTGTLPFLERAFHITTDISLLELADLNQPILKSLALEAPGTYNHSLTVGVLAEAAAETIGADDMLVRVGSYYHDIGKLNKPEYLIENSNSALYRHENLSPTMSTLIIIAHVKDGLEMAEDLGLPHAVRDIIAQHHGTTLVEFFYKKHQEEQKGGEELDDSTFRYPGPRPKTREAAVVMLADAAESASRTLSEPSPGSIESLVEQIIQGRLNDGQFSACNITLDELHRISRALVKGLNSIYHSRIRY